MPVTFTSNMTAILDSLAAKKAALPTEIAISNSLVDYDVRQALASLYPGRLSALWQVRLTPGSFPRLAMLQVETTEALVYYYEYGTAPHYIVPVNATMLKFPGTNAWAGTIVFTDFVDHPGAVAHNKRFSLLTAIDLSAHTQWKAAISLALSRTA